MNSIRKLGKELTKELKTIHGLINNAGAMLHKEVWIEEDNVESTIACAIGGTYLLTGMLLPLLKKGTPGRVVNVSSAGQYTVYLESEDVRGETRRGKKYDGQLAYALAKKAQRAAFFQEVFVNKVAVHGDVLQLAAHVGEADVDIGNVVVLDH